MMSRSFEINMYSLRSEDDFTLTLQSSHHALLLGEKKEVFSVLWKTLNLSQAITLNFSLKGNTQL